MTDSTLDRRIWRRMTSCLRKKRYRSEDMALQVARKAEGERQVKLRIYHCELCQGYHLTSKRAS